MKKFLRSIKNKTSMWQRLFAVVFVVGFAGYGAYVLVHGHADVITNQKLVWVHSIPIPSPTQVSGTSSFGANYPYFFMNTPDNGGDSRAAASVADAINAGFDGINLDVFVSGSGRIRSAITGYLNAADKTKLLVAPTIDLGTAPTGDAARIPILESNIMDYCTLAPQHVSAGKVGGKPVIFVYSGNGMSAGGFQTVKNFLNSQGCDTYWVVNAPQSQGGTNANYYQPYFSFTDMGWGWSGVNTSIFPAVKTIWNDGGKPYIGGIWPNLFAKANYDSTGKLVSPFRANPTDERGTEQYRQEWEQQLGANLPWMSVSTLDDYQEHHNVGQSSEWNTTRSDLSKWYAAKFHGGALPYTTPQLYISSPQALYNDRTAIVEGLVLNGSTSPVNVSVQIYDQTGAAVGSPTTKTIAGLGQDAAMAPISCAGSTAKGKWLYAKATLSNGTTVTSAPVLCYPVATASTTPFVIYQSIPAAHQLGHVDLEASGSGANTVVTVSAPTGTSVRFNDVLRNTQLIGTAFKTLYSGTTVSKMAQYTSGPKQDDRADTTDYGFYVARVTDNSGNVGYSYPYNSDNPAAAVPATITTPPPVTTPPVTAPPTQQPAPVVTPAPDLVITSTATTPASPKVGDTVTFSAVVKNNGTAATPAGTIIGVAFSIDGKVVNWSDTTKTALAAGASVTLTANSGPTQSATWNADTVGVKTLKAVVDDVNRIKNESNETNNTFSTNLTVLGRPDLVVTSVTQSPAKPKVGEAVTFTAVVTNNGTAATPDGTLIGVGFKVDGKVATWSDTDTTALAPGASVTLTANSSPSKSATWIADAAGTRTVTAFVDDVNRIPDESDETNNTFSQSFAVVTAPDLVVTDLSWTPASPANYSRIYFHATVKNIGSGPTPAGTIIGVSFLVDGKQVTWSDTVTSALAPGSSVAVTANNGPTRAPFWKPASKGTKSVIAFVDDINRIGESDESNNVLIKSIVIK
ncbi:MAG: hypothetical protein JWN38_509 [Candidatus Saccharibacteria bacterium]|nr:hypothetical protein [Candidatus Saccharibacteria bacterium]